MGVAAPLNPCAGVKVILPTSGDAVLVFTVHTPWLVVRVVSVHATVVPFCGGVVVGSHRRVAAFCVVPKVAPLLGVAGGDEPTAVKGSKTAGVEAGTVAERLGALARVVNWPSTSVTPPTVTERLVLAPVVVAVVGTYPLLLPNST